MMTKRLTTMMMKKIMMRTILGMMTCSVSSIAQQNQNQHNQNEIVQGIDIPKNTGAVDPQIIRNRVEMSTSDNAYMYKEMQVRRNERQKILNEVFDPSILMTPVKRTIRPIDTIGVSPTYITQIIFPDNMRIQNATASFACHILDYTRNLLRLRPDSKTFFSGNIVLTLTDGTKNYAMTIFAERYFQDDCRVDNGEYICRKKKASSSIVAGALDGGKNEGAYAYAYNNLSTFYVYVNPKKIDEMEAFLLYEKLSRKVLNIDSNGGKVTFKYEGVYYDIVRDDISGRVSYRGKQYSVVPRG